MRSKAFMVCAMVLMGLSACTEENREIEMGTAQVGDPVAGSMRKPQPMTARAVGRGISRREPSGMAGRSILLVRIVHDDLETDLAADAGVDPEAAPRQQGLAKIPLRRLCPGHLDLT